MKRTLFAAIVTFAVFFGLLAYPAYADEYQAIELNPCLMVGFLGEADDGPFTPQLISSFEEYTDIYGLGSRNGYLAPAVKGFFENGGVECYVARVEGAPSARASLAQYLGGESDEGELTGLAGLDAIGEISVYYAPDASRVPGLADALIRHCETKGDCMVFIDTASGVRIPAISGLTSRYAAVFHPWLKVKDLRSRKQTLVPPGGHILGLMMKTSLMRGINKAPSIQDTIKGVQSLEFTLSRGERDRLAYNGINTLGLSGTKGIYITSLKTTSNDSEYKSIITNRLLIAIKKSIAESLDWTEGSENDNYLWSEVKLSVSGFLENLWRRGMLQGRVSREAYFAKVDRTTMTQQDIDKGNLRVLVGVAVLKPAEFNVINISKPLANDEE